MRSLLLGIIVLALATAQRTQFIRGKVVDSRGRPLNGAVVQLENVRTAHIRSYITRKNGAFHFGEVDRNVEYRVRARFGKHRSDEQVVNRFDTSPIVEMTLEVETDED